MGSKQELIERIIEEQDLVCLYVINLYNKSIDMEKKYSEKNGIFYSGLDCFIFDNPFIN